MKLCKSSRTGYHNPYEIDSYHPSPKTTKKKYRCSHCRQTFEILYLPDKTMYDNDQKLFTELFAQDYLQLDHPDYELVYGTKNKQDSLKEFATTAYGNKISHERKERVAERKDHYKNNRQYL